MHLLNKRIKTSTMKKFLAIIALAGVFTACGNGSESTTTSDSIKMMETPMTDTSSKMMMDTSSHMMGDSSKMMGDSMKK